MPGQIGPARTQINHFLGHGQHWLRQLLSNCQCCVVSVTTECTPGWLFLGTRICSGGCRGGNGKAPLSDSFEIRQDSRQQALEVSGERRTKHWHLQVRATHYSCIWERPSGYDECIERLNMFCSQTLPSKLSASWLCVIMRCYCVPMCILCTLPVRLKQDPCTTDKYSYQGVTAH